MQCGPGLHPQGELPGPSGFWAELVLGAGGPWPEMGPGTLGGHVALLSSFRAARELASLGRLSFVLQGMRLRGAGSDLAEVNSQPVGPQRIHCPLSLGQELALPGAERVLAGVFAALPHTPRHARHWSEPSLLIFIQGCLDLQGAEGTPSSRQTETGPQTSGLGTPAFLPSWVRVSGRPRARAPLQNSHEAASSGTDARPLGSSTTSLAKGSL